STIRHLLELGLDPFEGGGQPDLDQFVDRLCTATTARHECTTVGYELFPGQLPDELVEHLMAKRPRVILLYRANLLRAAVSHALAGHTGVWGHRDDEEFKGFEIDPRQLLVFMRFYRAGLERFRSMLCRNEIDHLEIEFGDVLRDATAGKVFDYLAVEPFPDLVLPLVRPTNEDRYRQVINIDQIDELLSSDEDGQLFESSSP
ncbi:MAG: hypothetical protein V3V01_19560, partial [Acidimicrobiales bacterium]